jgi:hypothetical protein
MSTIRRALARNSASEDLRPTFWIRGDRLGMGVFRDETSRSRDILASIGRIVSRG